MSNNTLVAKIKADAEAKAAELKKAAEAEVSTIQKETEAKLAVMREEHESALMKQNKHLELVVTSRAKQAGKISLQQAKRSQIDAIFAEVVDDLVNQPAESYVAYFTKMVKEIVPTDSQVTKILSPAKRLEESKKIISQSGLNGEVSEDGAIMAGLVIETADGVYDVTLDRLLSEQRSEIEMEIVKEVTT